MLIEPLLDSVCGLFLFFPTGLTELKGRRCMAPLQELSRFLTESLLQGRYSDQPLTNSWAGLKGLLSADWLNLKPISRGTQQERRIGLGDTASARAPSIQTHTNSTASAPSTLTSS